MITVFNKQDLLTEPVILQDFQADATVPISAATGAGIDALESKLEEVLRGQKALVGSTFPYKDMTDPVDPQIFTGELRRISGRQHCCGSLTLQFNMCIWKNICNS